jgi:hypothetical protein
MAKTNEVESAKLILEKEKKERGEKAAKALEAWSKEYNVQLVQVVKIGDKSAPIQNILALPVALEIHPL